MTAYPPAGDYDERLLDKAPIATRAEKQEGYNVNLLASDNSESPMNTRPAATIDGHTSLEVGTPPTKENYVPPYSVPWHRQKKWRIFMLVAAIILIAAIVGGVVGGVLSHNNSTKKNTKSKGTGPSTLSLPTSTSSSPTSITAGASEASRPPSLSTGSAIPSATGGGGIGANPGVGG